MDHRARRTLLILVTAGVWAAVLAASFGRLKLAARASVTINLATRPPVVRLTVDGERLYDGAYTDTPVKLAVPPGHHKLKISRDGYIAHLVTVEGDPGEAYAMEDVVLQRSPTQAFAAADVTAAPGDPPWHVDIDDGLAHGDTPLTITDLAADTPHVLTVYPKWPDKGSHIRCRFTPPADDGEAAVYHVKLKGKGGKVRLTNCERPKEPGREKKGH